MLRAIIGGCIIIFAGLSVYAALRDGNALLALCAGVLVGVLICGAIDALSARRRPF